MQRTYAANVAGAATHLTGRCRPRSSSDASGLSGHATNSDRRAGGIHFRRDRGSRLRGPILGVLDSTHAASSVELVLWLVTSRDQTATVVEPYGEDTVAEKAA